MKPMIIIPPGQMDQANIKLLRENDICVVVTKNPERIKFVDPIPAVSQRGEIEKAAIKLSRLLLNPSMWNNSGASWNKEDIANVYTSYLIQGTSLDSRGTKEEQEEEWYSRERRVEVEKMAREDARAEREAKKKVLLSTSTPTAPSKMQ